MIEDEHNGNHDARENPESIVSGYWIHQTLILEQRSDFVDAKRITGSVFFTESEETESS